MTSLSQIPFACKALLDAFPGLPSLGTLVLRNHEIESEIEEAVNRLGMFIYVMPVLPKRVVPGVDFVFFEDAEVRVRLGANPTLNSTGMDVYEAMAQTVLCLHGTNPGELLAEPLRVTTFELIEDPEAVIFDLIFTAAFQLNP